jgi:hypothetical protein
MIMQRIFISNNSNIQSPDFKITKDFNVNNLIISDKYKNGDFVFIIDVHCIFDGVKKLQEQGGVIFYRYLLKQFKECQDKLKVIFYSPIAAEYLVRLKPENYILNLLPFIELFPIDKESRNWSFEDALKPFIDENYNFPQFNNASENLLSGWAAFNEEKIKNGNDDEVKIKLNKSKLCIVDDEFLQWQSTYLTIFDFKTGDVRFPPYSSQSEFRQEWKEGKALDNICDQVKDADSTKDIDAVLSDLYIEEDHEKTKPYKTRADVEKISGFKLLKIIKEKYPYLPYMMFTTSNKVWNAEAFRSEGVWVWAVKNNSENVGGDDKAAQFEHFLNCINKIVNPEWRFVSRVWKDLIQFQAQPNLPDYWWYKDCAYALDIIRGCLLTLDSVYSQRGTFETEYISDFIGRQCFQLFNNLGGLCEVLQINPSGDKRKFVGVYIYQIRNFYSHQLFYKFAKPIEAIFCIDLVLKLLMLNSDEFNTQPAKDKLVLDEFVENTNLNYLLQFEAYASRVHNIKYDPELFNALKQSFSGIKEKIISDSFDVEIENLKKTIIAKQNKIKEYENVKKIIDSYVKGSP